VEETKYLFQRNGIWWAKVAVPRSLRDELGYDLRRSLRTRDLQAARLARDAVVVEFRRTIAEAQEQQRRSCRAPLPSGTGYAITDRQDFSDVTFLLEVEHPELARAAQPGQFVLVLAHEWGERIPLTIADFDRDAGTFTMVIQAVGKTTREMQQHCHAGTRLLAVVGPMGNPSDIGWARKVVCVGGGLGVAPVFPQLRAFKQHGAHVIGVVGFRSKQLIFWEDKFRRYCDELIICTDDGSAGIHGLVTHGLEYAIERHPDIDEVVAIGPPVMMRACAETTRPHGIHTTVSLNPIMVDGTGMCGGCRVTVAGEMKFTCVDGPEFDAHQVDFGDLMGRQRRFREQEQQALATWQHEHEGRPVTV
jgi:NAD(P)H-flavin reductase